jgi:hypothetical protein
MHLPFAKSWLMAVGGCPIGRVSTAALERATQANLRTEHANARATQVAPTRTILGFELGQTHALEVTRWAAAHDLTCTTQRQGTLFQCKGVATSTLPMPAARIRTLDEVLFTFDRERHTLVALQVHRFRMPAEEMRVYGQEVRRYAIQTLGVDGKEAGCWSLASAGHYETATLRYRFNDVTADVTVTALPQGGAVRETYGLYPSASGS